MKVFELDESKDVTPISSLEFYRVQLELNVRLLEIQIRRTTDYCEKLSESVKQFNQKETV